MRAFFAQVISLLLSEEVTREEAAAKVAAFVPIDSDTVAEVPLLVACEWALRHANEPGYYTTKPELQYLLSCLNGTLDYSETGLADAVRTSA